MNTIDIEEMHQIGKNNQNGQIITGNDFNYEDLTQDGFIKDGKISLYVEKYGLPETFLYDRKLTPENFKKIVKQWNLIKSIQGCEIQNDIKLRQTLGSFELKKGTLVHGIRKIDLSILNSISEHGILSGELLGIPEDCETNYCADFFVVPEDMSVSEYIDWCNDFEPNLGSRLKRKRSEFSYLGIGKRCKAITVIINSEAREAQNIRYYDAYKKDFTKLDEIITQRVAGFGNDRLSAVLCGIPSNLISGIIVSVLLSQDKEYIKQLRKIFGNKIVIFNNEGKKI